MGIFEDIKNKLSGASSEKPPEMQSAQDQPREDIELATYVKNYFEEVRSQAQRVSQEAIWMTNIAYLLGFDSVYYDPSLKTFRPMPNNASPVNYLRKDRLHSNVILPDVQNRLARMLKSPPKYDVRPEEMDEENKEACRLGIEIINMVWDKQGINRKRIEHGMWLQQCGHAYIKVSHDEELGDPLPAIEDGGTSPGHEGEVRIDVVSAFEGYPDPLAKSWDELTKFGQAKVRKLDYFRTHYENGHLVKEEGAWLLSAQYEMRINTLNTVGPSSSGGAEQMKNAAIELNYYEKPSKKHPNGRHVIVANGVVLKNGDLPCGEIPFAKFDDVIVGGKFYSESLITHVRPLVDQYNRLLNKRAQWENRLLAGKYIVAKGHNVINEAFTDQSGEIIAYDPVNGAAEPKAMDIPLMPDYVYKSEADLLSQIHAIFGLSEVSRGQLPSAGIPGIGIQLLLEQDETRIGIEVESQEYGWARVGQLILKFVSECYVTPRKLKTKGSELEYKIKEFSGADLKGNTDVIVIRGSTVPNSKVVKRQEIINLWQQGLLGAPQDPTVIQQVLGWLEYGEVGQAWKKYHLDMTQIKESIEMIEQEIAPPVNMLDNHLLHAQQKNNFRLEKGSQLTPIQTALLEADLAAHAEWGAKMLNPALMSPPPEPPAPMPPELSDPSMISPDLSQEQSAMGV